MVPDPGFRRVRRWPPAEPKHPERGLCPSTGRLERGTWGAPWQPHVPFPDKYIDGWSWYFFCLQTKLSNAIRCWELDCVWSGVGGGVRLGHQPGRCALCTLKTQLRGENPAKMYARRERSFITNYSLLVLPCTLCQAKDKTWSKQLWSSAQRFRCLQFLQISVAIPKFPSTYQAHTFATQEYLFWGTVLS